jgi:hypothetical protein
MKMLLRTTAVAVTSVLCALVGAVSGVTPAHAATPPAMRLSFIQGDVQVKPNGVEDYGVATVNQPVSEGDQLWLPENALSELQMQSGAFLRLDQSSAAQILTATQENALQISLTQGHAYVFYDAPTGGSIQLDTPKHSIRAYENAVFRVDLSETINTVGVLDGAIEVETADGLKKVSRGQMLTFSEDGGVELGPTGQADDWENWNNQRNAQLQPKEEDQSKANLPSELQTYASDMTSGKWEESKEHGHVWKPQDVDEDWTPYSNGRWVSYNDEYTWVGYEPWGWAPYHYGRWVYIDGDGWVWVPPVHGDVYWAPGYVSWYETDDYVGWAPLWPGEYYYGHGYYGHYSVDIHVGGHFHHEHHFHDHGMRMVHRNDFGHHGAGGRGYNYHKGGSDTFKGHPNGGLRAGGPSIKPGHDQHFASNRPIGHDKAPPSHVRNANPAQMKNSRPMTTRSGESSFNHGGGKPATMHTKPAHQAHPFAGSGKGGGSHYSAGAAGGGQHHNSHYPTNTTPTSNHGGSGFKGNGGGGQYTKPSSGGAGGHNNPHTPMGRPNGAGSGHAGSGHAGSNHMGGHQFNGGGGSRPHSGSNGRSTPHSYGGSGGGSRNHVNPYGGSRSGGGGSHGFSGRSGGGSHGFSGRSGGGSHGFSGRSGGGSHGFSGRSFSGGGGGRSFSGGGGGRSSGGGGGFKRH